MAGWEAMQQGAPDPFFVTEQRVREITLADALHALHWAADGEFSAHVTPAQSRLLLAEIQRLREESARRKERLLQLSSSKPSSSGT